MEKKQFKIPWVTMSAVLLMIIQAVLGYFDIKVDAPVVNELITIICGMLAVAGFVAPKPDEAGTPGGTDNTDAGFGTEINKGDAGANVKTKTGTGADKTGTDTQKKTGGDTGIENRTGRSTETGVESKTAGTQTRIVTEDKAGTEINKGGDYTERGHGLRGRKTGINKTGGEDTAAGRNRDKRE